MFFFINKLKIFLLVFCLVDTKVCGLVDYLLEIVDLNFIFIFLQILGIPTIDVILFSFSFSFLMLGGTRFKFFMDVWVDIIEISGFILRNLVFRLRNLCF